MKKFLLFTLLLLSFTANIFSQEEASFRIGVFLDMSGQTSSFGTATHNGIKMAVDEINAKGGIDGRKLEIVLEDDEGRPEKAKTVVQKLISEKKVHAIIGEVASTNSLAAAPEAQSAKIPMISSSSTNPKVTEVGDYIFRACFVDPYQGEAMAGFAFYELNIRKVAILGDVNSDYSKGLTKTFTDTFTKLGGKIVATQLYTQSDPDFKAQLVAVRSKKPDALYLPGYYGQVGIIAKQARELKMKMPLLGGDGWDSPELWKLGGEALSNSYISNHFAADDSSAAVRNFNQKYEAIFNIAPDALAALGYDSVYILADALRRAKTTDRKKLRDAIEQTANFYGVTGKMERFNAARNPIKPAVILKIDPQSSSFKYYSTIQP